MSLFSRKPEKYKKQRTLQDGHVKSVRRENTDQDDELENLATEVFSSIGENINLANDLLPLFEEKSRATHIPVPEELVEIRAAVKRQDSSNTLGDNISFALFLTCLKKYEQLKIEYELLIKDTLSTNPFLGAASVTNLKRKIISGVSEEDLLIFSSMWFLNYTLSRYQEQFIVPKITGIASKHSEGLGVQIEGALVLAAATTFAAAIDTIYENIDDIATVAAGNIQTENIETEVLSGGRWDKLALKKVSENDCDIILGYAVEYIYTSVDQKYDPWINYLAVRQARNSSIDSYKYYPAYSKKTFLKLNSFGTDNQEEDYLRDALNKQFNENFERKFKQNTLAFSGSTHEKFSYLSKTTNEVLRTAAQSASYKMKKDQICCLVRIFTLNGNLGKRDLKIMLGILKAISATSVITYSNSAKKTLADIREFDVANYTIDYAKIVFSSLINSVYSSLYKNLNDEIVDNVALKCLAFTNLQELFVSGVEEAVDMFEKGSSDNFNRNQRNFLEYDHDIKERYMLRLLNDFQYILAQMLEDSLYECSELQDDVANELIDNAVTGLEPPSNQYTINIPEDVLDRYFSDSEPIEINTVSSLLRTSVNITIPAINRVGNDETSDEVIRNILKTCKIDISDEEIKQMLKDTDGSSR